MSILKEGLKRRFFVFTVAAAIDLLIISGWEAIYRGSQLPRDIADVTEGPNFYRLYAACGSYDVTGPDYSKYGEKIYQIHDNRKTIVAHTNNTESNITIEPDHHWLSPITKRLGYFSYKGRFDNRAIVGGIFCPPRNP